MTLTASPTWVRKKYVTSVKSYRAKFSSTDNSMQAGGFQAGKSKLTSEGKRGGGTVPETPSVHYSSVSRTLSLSSHTEYGGKFVLFPSHRPQRHLTPEKSGQFFLSKWDNTWGETDPSGIQFLHRKDSRSAEIHEAGKICG